jgi:hypothetical protein
MKTTSPNLRVATRNALDETRPTRFPVTDYAFQSLVLDGFRGRCAPACGRSFRSISDNYFNKEARQSFAGEAAFFVAMIVTAAWPIVQNMHAVINFVRAINGV